MPFLQRLPEYGNAAAIEHSAAIRPAAGSFRRLLRLAALLRLRTAQIRREIRRPE
jgi:hypothetical protein